MAIYRYTLQWTGGRIGTGATVLHFHGTGNDAAEWTAVGTNIRTWLVALAAKIPTDVRINFPTEVEMLDEATGELTEVIPVVPAAQVPGTGSSPDYAAPAGRIVRWSTPAVAAGRRLVGHTYLVPSSTSAYSGASISSSTLSTDNAAHSALLTALDTSPSNKILVVWSRKHLTWGNVNGGATLARATTLRTRND